MDTSDNLLNVLLTDIEDSCYDSTKFPGSVIGIVGNFGKLVIIELETDDGLVQFVPESTHEKKS